MNILLINGSLVEEPDGSLQSKTVDEVFDTIEPVLCQLENECKSYALQIARGDNVSQNIHKLTRCKNTLKGLNSLWEFLQTDTRDTYYVDSHFETSSWLTPADYWYKDHIFVPIRIIQHQYSTKLTLDRGAIVVDEPYEILGYRPLSSSRDVYDDNSELASCQSHVDNINRNYRIFRCKSCGVITCSSHAHDENMISIGLSPIQRCDYCRAKRRAERINTETLSGYDL